MPDSRHDDRAQVAITRDAEEGERYQRSPTRLSQTYRSAYLTATSAERHRSRAARYEIVL